MNAAHASTLGPIDPAGQRPSASPRSASSRESRGIRTGSGHRTVLDPVDVGQQEQPVRADGSGQHHRGEVLVDDRLEPHQATVRDRLDRHTATARRDDQGARLDGAGSPWIPPGEGSRRSDHPPPAIAVAGDRPAPIGGQTARPGLVVSRPDELRRVGERRIVAVDHRLGQDDRDAPAIAERPQRRQERLGEEIADLTLGLGAQHVQRRRRHGLGGDLRLEREEADLRPVAVGHHEPAVPCGDRGQRLGGTDQVVTLDGHRAGFATAQEGVPAEGDDETTHPRDRGTRCRGPGAQPTIGRPSPVNRLPVVVARDEGVQQGKLGVEPVLGLLPDPRCRPVDDRIDHLLAAMGGQAVEEDRVPGGPAHERLVDPVGTEDPDPLFVLRVVTHRGPDVGVDGGRPGRRPRPGPGSPRRSPRSSRPWRERRRGSCGSGS